MIAGVCRVCGCTDSRPCIVDADTNELVDVGDFRDTLPEGFTVCSWIEPDLCSACVRDRAPAMLFDIEGNPIGRAP